MAGGDEWTNDTEFQDSFWSEDYRIDLNDQNGSLAVARLKVSNERVDANPEKFRDDAANAAGTFVTMMSRI